MNLKQRRRRVRAQTGVEDNRELLARRADRHVHEVLGVLVVDDGDGVLGNRRQVLGVDRLRLADYLHSVNQIISTGAEGGRGNAPHQHDSVSC